MNEAATIHLEKIQHGPWPAASRLNPKISDTKPLLRATLDIRWQPAEPAAALARLEASLLSFAPRFGRHECRGEAAYRVFRRGGDGPASPLEPIGFDNGLALAHLTEHATIEFLCAITGERRCSGVTAAHREPAGRYDLMVECADPRAGRCGLALAMAWLPAAIGGRPPGDEERAVLAVAGVVWRRGGRGVTAREAARAAGAEDRAARALAALRDVGFIAERPWSMNLSGSVEYRLAC